MLFYLILKLYERTSIIITTAWHSENRRESSAMPKMTTALFDRLTVRDRRDWKRVLALHKPISKLKSESQIAPDQAAQSAITKIGRESRASAPKMPPAVPLRASFRWYPNSWPVSHGPSIVMTG